MGSLMNECVIAVEERDKLERDLEKEVENERGVDKRLEKVKEEKKNIKIKLNKAADTPDNYTDDDVLKLFHELAKFSKIEKCLNDDKNKIKDRKKSIIAKKSAKTKELQELEDGINLILLKRKCKN